MELFFAYKSLIISQITNKIETYTVLPPHLVSRLSRPFYPQSHLRLSFWNRISRQPVIILTSVRALTGKAGKSVYYKIPKDHTYLAQVNEWLRKWRNAGSSAPWERTVIGETGTSAFACCSLPWCELISLWES